MENPIDLMIFDFEVCALMSVYFYHYFICIPYGIFTRHVRHETFTKLGKLRIFVSKLDIILKIRINIEHFSNKYCIQIDLKWF